MAKLRYPNDPRIVRKRTFTGTIVKTGEALWDDELCHVPCGCIVRETKQGWICPGCGNIAPSKEGTR